MKPAITGLLLLSVMVFATALHAQDTSKTTPRLAPDKMDAKNQFPDSVFNERKKPETTLPDEQRQFPDSVFDEQRQKPEIRHEGPDSAFDK